MSNWVFADVLCEWYEENASGKSILGASKTPIDLGNYFLEWVSSKSKICRKHKIAAKGQYFVLRLR
jgi:hypothetical protein